MSRWLSQVSKQHALINQHGTAKEILERDGLNELEKPPKPTLLLLFVMQHLGHQTSMGSCVRVQKLGRAGCTSTLGNL